MFVVASLQSCNCGVFFDKATRMSFLASNLFLCFVLIVRRAENPHSQVVAKGIRATMALFTSIVGQGRTQGGVGVTSP